MTTTAPRAFASTDSHDTHVDTLLSLEEDGWTARMIRAEMRAAGMPGDQQDRVFASADVAYANADARYHGDA